MSSLLNREPPKTPKINDKGEPIGRDAKCVFCKRMYICKGKPYHVKNCVSFEEKGNLDDYYKKQKGDFK